MAVLVVTRKPSFLLYILLPIAKCVSFVVKNGSLNKLICLRGYLSEHFDQFVSGTL